MKNILTFGCLLVTALAQAADTSAGRDWSQMNFGVNPSVSPDGSYFAFEWKDRVWLAPTAGGTAVPIGDGMSADTRPALSPDGKRIAFLSDRWGSRQLFEMDLDVASRTARNLRQVTFHTESLFPWGYTPDGSEMLALAYRDDASETSSTKRLSRRPILVSLGARKAEKLLFDAPAFCPSLSPDGRYVAAALRDGYNNVDVWGVPTWDVDEKGEKAPAPCNISRNWEWDGSPAWSPGVSRPRRLSIRSEPESPDGHSDIPKLGNPSM